MTDTDPPPGADPSILTTEQLLREVERVKDLMDARLAGQATLTDERFRNAERLRIEQKADERRAIDAALLAAKEAVKEQTLASERAIGKSEATTSKSIDEQGRRLDDLKERVLKVESSEGAARRSQDRIQPWQLAAATAVLAVFVLLANYLTSGSG